MSVSLPAAPPSEGLGHIKGAAFREFLDWWDGRPGAMRLREVVAAVDPDLAREFLRTTRPILGILPSKWYPAELVHSMMDVMVNGLSEGEQDRIADDAAREIVHRTFKGAYRALIWMFGSPARYAKDAQRFWDMHYDNGRMEVRDQHSREHDGRHECFVSDWRSHHPFLCRLNFAAVVPIYSFMGCKQVKYERTACISRGDPVCINRAEWR